MYRLYLVGDAIGLPLLPPEDARKVGNKAQKFAPVKKEITEAQKAAKRAKPPATDVQPAAKRVQK